MAKAPDEKAPITPETTERHFENLQTFLTRLKNLEADGGLTEGTYEMVNNWMIRMLSEGVRLRLGLLSGNEDQK